MIDVNVDLLGQGMGQGDVAAYMMERGKLDPGAMRPFLHTNKNGVTRSYVSIYRGGDPNDPKSYAVAPINTNATLRRDEWKQLDDAVTEVARQRLGGVEDLISKGLTYNLGNAMGTTVLEWHDVSDAMEATITMDGVTRGSNDRPVYEHNYLPIPIIHVDYEINARVLAASRNMGNPLDTTSAERAARRINEKLEKMLFTNTTYKFGELDSKSNNSIYSYVNYPHRNTLSFSDVPGVHWNDSGASGADIVGCVLAMKQESIDNLHYGPWQLYIPTAYETVLDGDYDATTPGTTIRERIMKIAGIGGIKVIDTLTADNVLLIQMTSDVVRLVRGMGIQNVEWQTEGKFITKYKVLTIQVPQIRSDQNGKCGIVHLA